MTEEDFLERWFAERPLVQAWGKFVAQKLVECVAPRVAPVSTDIFIRIPMNPRVKGEGSLVTKAFYRGKEYQDPLAQITDKVGVRLVVLLAKEIDVVAAAIEGCPEWEASKDRDFEAERAAKPTVFDYQSVHYVVRARNATDVAGVTVPAGTPCEVQVRTLLQHAHSEVTHDTLYKPSVIKTAEMQRAASKSMALIEIANDYFEELMELVERNIAPGKKLAVDMAALYHEMVGRSPDSTRAEDLLIDAFAPFAAPDPVAAARALFTEKGFLLERLRELAPTKLLFRQPSIMLAYVAVAKSPEAAKDAWPLTRDELKPLYEQLGIAWPES